MVISLAQPKSEEKDKWQVCIIFLVYLINILALGEAEPLHHVTDAGGAVWGPEDALDAVKPAILVIPALRPGAWKKTKILKDRFTFELKW